MKKRLRSVFRGVLLTVLAFCLSVVLMACGSSGDSPVVPTNFAPIADAGVDQSVTTGELVTLDGTSSWDPNGDGITFAWSMMSQPPGSSAVLLDATLSTPYFTADMDGEYIITLVVFDGKLYSTEDIVLVTASTGGNIAPVANAGIDQNVTIFTLATLDGSDSSDANGDSLTYSWTIDSQPGTATLSDPTAMNPTFMPNAYGTYIISLVVNDGTVDSAADTVTVTVSMGNSAPVANAGYDQSVTTGTLVTLDGSGSTDPELDPLTYSWTIDSQPGTATLSDPTAMNPTFTPDVDGEYIISLVVNDGTVDSASDSVTVTASTGNSAPVANAGIDQSVLAGDLVTLDGSGSTDADFDLLTYAWTFTTVPAGSTAALSDATVVDPTFTADLDGDYVLSLTVNDGTVDSAADSVIITAAGLIAEGTVADPVDLTGLLPYDGTVDTTYSYYMIPTTSGKSYSVSMAGLTDDADLRVYFDSGFTSLACSDIKYGTDPETCTAEATGAYLYVKVTGAFTTAGTSFTLGSTELAGTNYYIETFGNLALTADTYLYLYASDGSTLLASDDDSGAGLFSQLTYLMESGQTYYIKIAGSFSTTAGGYSIALSATGFGASSSVLPGDPDMYETADNTSAGATTLAVDVVQDHSLTSGGGDVDWFRFVAP